MFKDNLMMLRKTRGMTQEELAEKIDVSRQTLSKYETGESLPDVEKSRLIAEVFDVTLDELVNYEGGETHLPFPPKGEHAFGMVKVGEKGQIVIPAKARKIFDIKPGDVLMVLGDEEQGIALLKEQDFMAMVQAMRHMETQNCAIRCAGGLPICKITQARPSRAQVGSILFALASVIYVLGFLRSSAALHCQKSFTGLSRHFRCSLCICCLPRKSWMLCALYGIR